MRARGHAGFLGHCVRASPGEAASCCPSSGRRPARASPPRVPPAPGWPPAGRPRGPLTRGCMSGRSRCHHCLVPKFLVPGTREEACVRAVRSRARAPRPGNGACSLAWPGRLVPTERTTCGLRAGPCTRTLLRGRVPGVCQRFVGGRQRPTHGQTTPRAPSAHSADTGRFPGLGGLTDVAVSTPQFDRCSREHAPALLTGRP